MSNIDASMSSSADTAGQATAGVIPGHGRVLALDLGARRIGVAVTDSDQSLALGVTTVARTRDLPRDRRAIAELVTEYEAVGLVVGLPLSLDGGTGPAAQAALDEAGHLRAVLGVPVETADERMTTVTASAALRAGGRSYRDQRAVVDRTAAAVILQSWVDQRRARDAGATGG
jgi:putative Holliday junction resolvase